MIFWPLHILKFEILTVGNFKFEFFWIENFYWPLLYPIPKHGVLTMNTHWVSLNWGQGVVVGLLIKTTVVLFSLNDTVLQSVVLKLRVNFDKNQFSRTIVSTRFQIASVCLQNNRKSWYFDYFSWWLKLTRDHYIKNLFSIKNMVFWGIYYVFIYRF